MVTQFLSCPQVSDSGIPPLSSSTSVRVHVTEQSHYPPSALPLEVFITIGEEEFQGGLVGKIHATDRDPQDTLTYSLAEAGTLGRHFSVGALDGKIIAAQGLPRGRYTFNVTVSDGTFTTAAGVHVQVWHVGREALQQSVWMGFHQLTPEELVSDHWRNLQRFLSNKLDIKRANIHLASLQPTEAMAGVDVLLVFEGHSRTFHKMQELATIITRSAKEMEHSVGIQMRSAMPVAPCHGPSCLGQICQETVQLGPRVGPTYSTARLSILTPRHRLERNCSCNGEKWAFPSTTSTVSSAGLTLGMGIPERLCRVVGGRSEQGQGPPWGRCGLTTSSHRRAPDAWPLFGILKITVRTQEAVQHHGQECGL